MGSTAQRATHPLDRIGTDGLGLQPKALEQTIRVRRDMHGSARLLGQLGALKDL